MFYDSLKNYKKP